MTTRIARNVIAALMIGTGSVAISAPLALAVAVAPSPNAITNRITDESGVLSASDKSTLEAKIQKLQKNEQLLFYAVYVEDLGGQSAENYAQSITQARGANTAAFVVDTKNRKAALATGNDWKPGERDKMWDAAYAELSNSNWAGAANAAVDTALGKSSGSGSGTGGGSGDGASAAWLAAGGAAIVAAGGGVWVASRRKSKKDSAKVLESARAIEPADTRRLSSLDLDTLDKLAHEELVSTDESIRRGKEELDLAMAEFGPERVRPFTKAMNHSTTTLQRAFELRQRLDDAIPESEQERRQMLVEIVSSCGQADDALDAQAAEFASMRDLLVNAGSKLDELTQRTVGLRARLAPAAATLDGLKTKYTEDMLHSVADNADMAEVSLAEAEKNIEAGRGLLAKPAGEQGGMVNHIREAEHAIELTDRLLGGIEHADSNIADAKAGLSAMIAEVEGEIAEARDLEAKGKANGSEADWAALEDVVTRAGHAVEAAKTNGESDPLGSYTQLTTIDTELDHALDTVREITADRARSLELYSQQINTASAQIQGAEDLISSRGRIIGSGARTALADAKRLYAQALQAQGQDIKVATEYARQATNAAAEAMRRAKNDCDNYRRRQQRNNMSSGASNLITGMVIGQMLGGGGGGGFGGGFGGGGFSGGGGGGVSGGAF